MSAFGWLRKRIHDIATLGPLLRLLGIKSKTAVGKGAEVAEELDKILPKESDAKP